MGPLVAAIYGVSIQVGEHPSTHVSGLSVWGFVVLVVVVSALVLGFVARRRRKQRRATSGETG